MNRFIYTLLLIPAFSYNIIAGTIVIEGKYQNKNLYIQNSFADNGVGFCAYEVIINGHVTTDEVASKTFEIDFSALPIEVGANVVVEIKCKSNCTPKVLNPEVLRPHLTFEIVDIKVDKKGLLMWSTINEQESLPFIVEQFRWNKWIKVGEINGKGKNKIANSYTFQPVLNSGENKFRVKQVGFEGLEKRSESVSFKSTIKPFSHKINREKSIVQFSEVTLFEVYDVYGNVVKYGYGDSLNIANLAKGFYFVCYDNVVADFTKE